MPSDRSAPTRAPFLQTPESLIDNVELSATSLRLLQAMVKLAPRNARNSDAVARGLRMGKDRTNAARKALRAQGHWHARKRQNVRGEIRDQRLASLVPLCTKAEAESGWRAAEEAARLGKDTADSRRLGVRILNSNEWLAPERRRAPAAGSPVPRLTRRRPQGDETENGHHTPLSVPAPLPPSAPAPECASMPLYAAASASASAPAASLTVLGALTGALAPYAQRAERALLALRATAPSLVLTHPQARELAQIAGHFLLRGEGPETLRAVITHGLPPEGVRCPHAFVRARLLRYLPPVPAWPPASAPVPAAPVAPTGPPRPGGPVSVLREGHGWRAALAKAAATGTAAAAAGVSGAG